MTPVIPNSISTISLIPGTAITTRRNQCSTRCKFLQRSSTQTLQSPKYILPLSTSARLFPLFRFERSSPNKSRTYAVLATGTDVAIEEPDSTIADEVPDGGSVMESADTGEKSSVRSDASAPPPAQTKRARPGRKSEMPPVKNEELVPGATFTGKVRSIQLFGAFVDFGAFTDGLVHVSQLSDSFVKDVASVVSVGQEVKVRLLEANTETGRISLTMRESEDASKGPQQKDSPASGDRSRPARRGPPKFNKNEGGRKGSKFVKGQDLEGTVKNLARSGAFISLPEGEEGFLPASEESNDEFANIMGESSLTVGQEVSVRVLRFSRGQVTLTMKKEEDVAKLDQELIQGVVHGATNPFLLAFRKNEDIAAFLDERENEKEATVQVEEQDQPSGSNIESVTVPSVEDGTVEDPPKDPESVISESVVGDATAVETVINDEKAATGGVENDGESGQAADEILSPESLVSQEITDSPVEDVIAKDEVQSPTLEVEDEIAKDEVQSPTLEVEDVIAKDEVQSPTLEVEDEISSASSVVDETTTGNSEETASSVISSSEEIDGPPQDSAEEEIFVGEEVTEKQDDNITIKDEVPTQASATDVVIPSATSSIDEVEIIPEKNDSASNSREGAVSSPKDGSATISSALVKQLREETGAGMMDCKKALLETGGDVVKALEFLRKKGLASADKKASRATAEGRIGSYIHDSRIGILIEVNCETDFVSRGDIFKELVDDLAMQVAACPQVQYLVVDDVPKEIVDKEREIEMQKEDLLSKPEQIRSKIVEGRIKKRFDDQALLEQPYIKNDKVVVKDWVKQTIATVGENMKVRRFVRFNLGEGLERKSQDFAAEVAAQTAAKPVSAPGKEQPASVEAEQNVEKAPKVAVSAALVKQLREETGAGMMDCKKALSETGGDLEKAQEYLRKKGLSAADKKSSRLAAEGRIGSYIHDARIGVLLEVNCETDFVGRSERFQELVNDLAMQVAACPKVEYVSVEDIPESTVSKEKALEMQREDLQSKPENIRERIVDGRIAKRLGELALLEQPFIKDDSVLVKDLVKQTVAALGENIKVRRFARFTLGEELGSAETENEA